MFLFLNNQLNFLTPQPTSNHVRIHCSTAYLTQQPFLGSLPAGTTDADLWHARKIKEAIIHPDFNKPIPAIARMASFAPASVPICALLLWPTNNSAFIIGAQIINQTYNVTVNYGNRSASGEMSNSLLAGGMFDVIINDHLFLIIFTAYFGAVGTSVGIAYSLNKVAKVYQAKPNLSPAARALVRGLVPFFAVASAGIVNVLMIRQNELTKGIAVFDEFVSMLRSSPLLDLCVKGRARTVDTQQLPAAMPWPSAVLHVCFGTSR